MQLCRRGTCRDSNRTSGVNWRKKSCSCKWGKGGEKRRGPTRGTNRAPPYDFSGRKEAAKILVKTGALRCAAGLTPDGSASASPFFLSDPNPLRRASDQYERLLSGALRCAAGLAPDGSASASPFFLSDPNPLCWASDQLNAVQSTKNRSRDDRSPRRDAALYCESK